MSKPIVAVVGRPNVGKSTLFNRLIGKRISIIDDTPGVTRDRIYGECEWRGKTISIIDTGGIEFEKPGDEILAGMKRQAELAIELANIIIFVVDVKSGPVAADQDIAVMLKKSGKPVIVCVNKCDNVSKENYNFYEFYNLGLGDPIQVSSVHGHGTGDLLDAVFENLPEFGENEGEDFIQVAVIGKPNVGKSSLVNFISGIERSIVSDIAGTTRDAIDMKIINKHGNYNFIDTAGIRRQSKISDTIEKYSVMRAKLAIEQSDVCVIMIDAFEGATEQDTKIAGLAHEAGKSSIIFVNKWDTIEKDDKTMDKFKKKLNEDFAFMAYVPMIFASVKTGQRVNDLFTCINRVVNSRAMRISTGTLNNLLSQAIVRVPAPTHKGKRLKIYYMTQVGVKPPTFAFFINKTDLFHFSYRNYIENNLRNAFGFEGTPIRFVFREKSEKNI